MSKYLGDLTLDAERQMREHIGDVEERIVDTRGAIEQVKQSVEKHETCLHTLYKELGVTSWQEAVAWWTAQTETQLSITGRINRVDEELAVMEERLMEAERAARRFRRQQRRALTNRQLELKRRLESVLLLQSESSDLESRVNAGNRMLAALCSEVEKAFFLAGCHRMRPFKRVMKLAKHAMAHQLKQEREAKELADTAAQREEEALFGGYEDDAALKSPDHHSRKASQVDKFSPEEMARIERTLALYLSPSKGGRSGTPQFDNSRSLAAAEGETTDSKDEQDDGESIQPRLPQSGIELVLGEMDDTVWTGASKTTAKFAMLGMLRNGCTQENLLHFLSALERTTATLVGALQTYVPEARRMVESMSESRLFNQSFSSLPADNILFSPPIPPDEEDVGDESLLSEGLSKTLDVHQLSASHLDAPTRSLAQTAPAARSLSDLSSVKMRMGRAWGTPLLLSIDPPTVKVSKGRSRADREADALAELARHARQGSDIPDSAIARVLRAAKREANGPAFTGDSSSESSESEEEVLPAVRENALTAGIVFRRASVSRDEGGLPVHGGRRGSISMQPMVPATPAREDEPVFSSIEPEIPKAAQLRRMASGHLGGAGSLTPLGGGIPAIRADGRPESTSPGSPPPGDSSTAARVITQGSVHTGAPRKALSPLASAGGMNALERPTKGWVERVGSHRDLSESIRRRAGSEAQEYALGDVRAGRQRSSSAVLGLSGSPMASGSPPFGAAANAPPEILPLSLDAHDDDTSDSEAGEAPGEMDPAFTPHAGARSSFAVPGKAKAVRKSLVGGMLPVTNVPQKRFAHSRRSVQPETVVVPTPSNARTDLFGAQEQQLPAMQRLGGKSESWKKAPKKTGEGEQQGLKRVESREIHLVSKPTFHLHANIRHLPEDPDVSTPLPGDSPITDRDGVVAVTDRNVFSELGSVTAPSARAGTWERRGTYAEAGDASKAGGRGDDDTSIPVLVEETYERLRKSRVEAHIAKPMHAVYSSSTGIAKTPSTGRRGHSRQQSRERSSPRPTTSGKQERLEMKEDSELIVDAAAVTRRPGESQSKVSKGATASKNTATTKKQKKKPKKKKKLTTSTLTTTSNRELPEAVMSLAKEDIDRILTKASAQEYSRQGAYMREVGPSKALRPMAAGSPMKRRPHNDPTGGGARLSHQGSTSAKALAVSTSGLGTSKAVRATAAMDGLSAISDLATAISAAQVERDVAQIAREVRSRRSEPSPPQHLVAEIATGSMMLAPSMLYSIESSTGGESIQWHNAGSMLSADSPVKPARPSGTLLQPTRSTLSRGDDRVDRVVASISSDSRSRGGGATWK
jgi:hypothetical protein